MLAGKARKIPEPNLDLASWDNWWNSLLIKTASKISGDPFLSLDQIHSVLMRSKAEQMRSDCTQPGQCLLGTLPSGRLRVTRVRLTLKNLTDSFIFNNKCTYLPTLLFFFFFTSLCSGYYLYIKCHCTEVCTDKEYYFMYLLQLALQHVVNQWWKVATLQLNLLLKRHLLLYLPINSG